MIKPSGFLQISGPPVSPTACKSPSPTPKVKLYDHIKKKHDFEKTAFPFYLVAMFLSDGMSEHYMNN